METLEMRKILSTLPLAKPRQNAKSIPSVTWETMEGN
jgi:hypothetical protein